jgi:hypothetical protein
VSANEVSFSRERADAFHLYRLFEFRTSPRMFTLNGSIETNCQLDATTFMASFG